MLGQFSVVEANGTESVNCSSKSFEGADPQPGVAKDCYCDWKNKMLTPNELKETKQFWRGFLAEKSARMEQVKAEAKAEEAQKEAAEAAKEQEIENKKDMEDSKKAKSLVQMTTESSLAQADGTTAKKLGSVDAAAKASIKEAEAEEKTAETQEQAAEKMKIKAEKEEERIKAAGNGKDVSEQLERAEEARRDAIKKEVAAALAKQSALHKKEMA